ncbi:hypothetical protein OC835_007136 [Tilletia horrida]|nr:hypothetical protein OC835_007136 [Tilletia horrida]
MKPSPVQQQFASQLAPSSFSLLDLEKSCETFISHLNTSVAGVPTLLWLFFRSRGKWRQPGLLSPIGELFAEAKLDGPSSEPFAGDAFFLIKNQKPTIEDFAIQLLGGSGQRPSRSALAKEWKFGCGTCGATNTRLADLRRHIERHHLPPPAPDSPTEELSRSSAFLQAVLGPSERVIGTVRDQEWPQAVLPAGRRDTVAIATATPTTGVVQAHRYVKGFLVVGLVAIAFGMVEVNLASWAAEDRGGRAGAGGLS